MKAQKLLSGLCIILLFLPIVFAESITFTYIPRDGNQHEPEKIIVDAEHMLVVTQGGKGFSCSIEGGCDDRIKIQKILNEGTLFTFGKMTSNMGNIEPVETEPRQFIIHPLPVISTPQTVNEQNPTSSSYEPEFTEFDRLRSSEAQQIREALPKYIESNGGNPNEWRIDNRGNIICTNDEGCVIGNEFGAYYIENTGFPPPGGFSVVDKGTDEDQWIKNFGALQELTPSIIPEVDKIGAMIGDVYNKAKSHLAASKGLAGWSSLLLPEESLKAWRNTVDETFSTLYLGTEYWSSAICGTYVDGEAHGMAFFEGAEGFSEVGAFVRASRTPAAIDENFQYEYIYRIEFSVRNGGGEDDPNALEPMEFNIELKGDRAVELFEQDQTLDPGERARRVGRNSITQDSNTFYNEACMEFATTPYKWKIPPQGVCVLILESGASPSGYGGGGSTSSTGGGTSSGGIRDI